MISTTLTRIGGATALGAAVTTLVLLLMQSLISADGTSVSDPEPAPPITFARLLEDEPVDVDDPPRPPPKPEEPPLSPRQAVADEFVIGEPIEFTAPRVAEPLGPAGIGLADGEALPVVKVRPVYPQRALSRGIEGHVLVQFTIDALGRVVDARVVEAQPAGIFDHAALQAVERFRYKPRVVNGEPTAVSGVRHLISFALDS